jgi:hypothetical protein
MKAVTKFFSAKFTFLAMTSFICIGFTNASWSDAGLVGYYAFNANADDLSGHGNNGTVSGATLTLDRFVHPDNAYAFDGIDDYIDIGADSSLKMTDALSISVWVRPLTFNRIYQNITSDHSTNETVVGAGKILRFNKNELQFIVGGVFGNGTAVYARHVFCNTALKKWHHIVGTYDGDRVKLFVNGKMVDDRAYNKPIIINSNHLLIGASGYGEYFKGRLDDIRFYNRALNETEIKILHVKNRSLNGRVNGLQNYSIICTNTKTGEYVTLPAQESYASWNCEAAGLKSARGDIIDIRINGVSW